VAPHWGHGQSAPAAAPAPSDALPPGPWAPRDLSG
jgi:hypothetical protein